MEKVYFKDYSGLDKTTAWGTIADDNYRNNEMKKCLEIKKIILENSNLIQTENIKTIKFNKTTSTKDKNVLYFFVKSRQKCPNICKNEHNNKTCNKSYK